MDNYLIGVDGGGSRCRALVCDLAGKVEARAESGPANIATDYDGARTHILEAIESAWQSAGLNPEKLEQAYCALGLAGANVGDFALRMRQELPFRHCRVSDDRATTLKGALADTDGCIAVVGTGSFFSSQFDGEERHIGGWGFVVGDDGSGARLGLELLRRVVLCHGGLLEHSGFSREILSEYDDSAALIAELSLIARPADFARYAPRIVDAADQQDSHGVDLIEQAVTAVQRSLDGVGFKPGCKICMLGGLGPALLDYMDTAYQKACVEPLGDALDGAILLAQRMLNDNGEQ